MYISLPLLYSFLSLSPPSRSLLLSSLPCLPSSFSPSLVFLPLSLTPSSFPFLSLSLFLPPLLIPPLCLPLSSLCYSSLALPFWILPSLSDFTQ